MKNGKPCPARSRAEILAEMANLPHAVQGKLSTYRSVTSSGRVITYHNLQWWDDGKNHSMHVPTEKVADIQKAIESGKRLWELATELTAVDANSIISSSALKKTSRGSSSGARRGSTR